MAFELSLFNVALTERQAAGEVLKCNELTARFGLELTEKQALALVATRSFALKKNGRIEFGGGIIDKMIREFCDSPYLSAHDYEETLHDLLETFYLYKNETLDLISDDDLIRYMKNAFDAICQGSVELLSERELYRLARNLRRGYDYDYSYADEGFAEDEENEYEGY